MHDRRSDSADPSRADDEPTSWWARHAGRWTASTAQMLVLLTGFLHELNQFMQ